MPNSVPFTQQPSRPCFLLDTERMHNSTRSMTGKYKTKLKVRYIKREVLEAETVLFISEPSAKPSRKPGTEQEIQRSFLTLVHFLQREGRPPKRGTHSYFMFTFVSQIQHSTLGITDSKIAPQNPRVGRNGVLESQPSQDVWILSRTKYYPLTSLAGNASRLVLPKPLLTRCQAQGTYCSATRAPHSVESRWVFRAQAML